MKIKKGSKVEVLDAREFPSAWCCAQIISGNGHYYNVNYYLCSGIVERVPRKAIRPCPPSVKLCRSLEPGDVVEVFNGFSWRIAKILTVLGGNHFFVKLVGSFQEFKVHHSCMRVLQSWKDDKWVVNQEDSRTFDGKADDLEFMPEPSKNIQNEVVPSNHYSIYTKDLQKFDAKADDLEFMPEMCRITYDNATVEKKMDFLEPQKRGMKRSLMPLAAKDEALKKQRVVYIQQHLFAGNSSKRLEKVDAVASPEKLLAGKHAHVSYKYRTRHSKLETERRKLKAGFVLARSLNTQFENESCSVCSFSGSNNPDLLYHSDLKGQSLDLFDCSDDAQSVFEPESSRKHSIPPHMDMAAEVHKMEVHAYRSTLEALHASGPLSWEQEALLTNLRLMLHVSDDEHRMELRHLVFGPELGAAKLASKVQDDEGSLLTILPLCAMWQFSFFQIFAYGLLLMICFSSYYL